MCDTKTTISPTSQYRVVTVSTHNEGVAHYFDESCARFGFEPVILGMGTTWAGYGTKLLLLKEYIKDVDDDVVILFVDRFDLIFLRPLEPLFDFYDSQRKAQGSSSLLYIATEQPDMLGINTLYSKLHWGKYHDAMLNTGSFIATAKMINTMLDDVMGANHQVQIKDDQELVTTYLSQHPDVNVILDNNRRFLVYSAFRIDIGKDIHIEDEKLYFKQSDGTCYQPYLLHRNGSPPMSRIIRQLGYDMNKHAIGESSHLKRVFTNHLPHIWRKSIGRFVRQVAG